jgi:MFS family permease
VRPKLDIVGAGLIMVAAAALMYPLIQGREDGWPAWMFVSLAAGAALLAVFGLHIRARDRRGNDPLVLPSIFRRRAFSGGMVFSLAAFTAIMGLLLVFTLYMQLGLGFSPIHAGLTLIPFSLFVAVGAGLSGGMLAAKYGRPVITAGLVVLIAGVLALLAVVEWADDVTSWLLVPPQVLLGLGFGLFVAPYFDTVLAAVEDDEVGSASGTLNAIQQLGGAGGVAALGTLFFSVLDGHGFATACTHTLCLAVGLLVLAVALSFLLPRWARDPVDAG